MFTGIVQGTGTIAAVEETPEGRRIRVETEGDSGGALPADLETGASLSVAGVCLTVEDHGPGWFEAFLASETLDRTTLGERTPGDAVNLEPALPADGRFDGHLVQGHVDTTTTLAGRTPEGEDWTFEWDLPETIAPYVAEKGSIALDGVSLTVADRRATRFTTAIVPETLERTTFDDLAPGDAVNVEVDVIAKYVGQLLSADAGAR
jgi:riboflavin synthase